MHVVGVLLAAGQGRRLGGNKQLTPWPTAHGSGTLLSSAFDHIAVACDAIIVVLGHRHQEIQESLKPRVFETVLADADQEMARSVLAGFKLALEVDGVSCILLHPGDHPEVAKDTLEAIIESACRLDTAVAPQHAGHHGHPIAIPTRLARAIVQSGLPDGLAAWFRAEPSRRTFLDVDDTSVLLDIDTPNDLANAIKPAT